MTKNMNNEHTIDFSNMTDDNYPDAGVLITNLPKSVQRIILQHAAEKLGKGEIKSQNWSDLVGEMLKVPLTEGGISAEDLNLLITKYAPEKNINHLEVR